jgi:2Fe-2S ferredoxin
MSNITFKFEDKSPEQTFRIEVGESILEVALDHDIHLSHNCGGVCACSTCHIYVEKGDHIIKELSDDEEDFIDRARNPKINSRLACQCILEQDGDIVLIIPDQSGIIGH